ncbi:MAG: 4-hydroxybenzoate octaprenyltransferase [Thermoguttaceae bacterium]|nr:4-hydroxybenzoate octaprenyltransferase [Thermoguttaceae bacterium]
MVAPAQSIRIWIQRRRLVYLIRRFLELIRFSHTIFALPFAILAAMMAWYANTQSGWYAESGSLSSFVPQGFRWMDAAGILLCMVFARSTAMAFNRLADRKIDAKNPRTASRHLPAGTLSVMQVICFTLTCAAGFIASTALFLPANPLPLLFSVPVLLFLMGYSLAKRFTNYVHFWLGTALMLAPIAAWTAIRGEMILQIVQIWRETGTFCAVPAEFSALVLAAAVCLWSAGFDIIYATMDADFDRNSGVYSIPGHFGIANALRIAAFCHILVPLPLAALAFLFPPFQTLWLCGTGLISLLLIYEHWIVDPEDPIRVNAAFFNVNSIISVTLLAVGVLEMVLH